jgi:hypothetical protein
VTNAGNRFLGRKPQFTWGSNKKAYFGNLLLHRGNEMVLIAVKEQFFLPLGVKINSNLL